MLRAARLPTWPVLIPAFLVTKLVQTADRFFDPIPVEADRYHRRFFLGLGLVLVFTLSTYWGLTRYWDVHWLTGEDRLSEWWSVATYLASTAMLLATALILKRLGHPRIGVAYYLLAILFVFAALEEISWGQRLFGWGTPEALSEINVQQETTVHNIPAINTTFYTLFFWAAIIGLLGGVARAVLHRHRRVTTADFLLPSLVLSPALLMIIIWIRDGKLLWTFPQVLMAYLDLRPTGTEVPETLLGLCLVLYTFANLRRARAFRRLLLPAGDTPEKLAQHA